MFGGTLPQDQLKSWVPILFCGKIFLNWYSPSSRSFAAVGGAIPAGRVSRISSPNIYCAPALSLCLCELTMSAAEQAERGGPQYAAWLRSDLRLLLLGASNIALALQFEARTMKLPATAHPVRFRSAGNQSVTARPPPAAKQQTRPVPT